MSHHIRTPRPFLPQGRGSGRRALVALHCLIAAALLALVAQGAAAFGRDEAPRPNVVLIVVDDLGWADLACYGSRLHRTPHLDRLAAEGVRFTQAYAACPVCSPTRAALMTGKWPARLHLTDWLPGRPDMPAQKLRRPQIRQELPLEEITIAEALRSAGYSTASIGKWHLGGAGFDPAKQGFDLNVAGDHTGSPLSYFAPFQRNGRFMPGLEQAPEGEYLTDRLTAEAIRFIEANRERPFFVYLPHYTVHIPLRARPDLVAKYPEATPFRGTQNNPIYAAMIESLDEGVGRILRALSDLKLDDRTVIVFTSDNGGLCVTEGPNTPATSNAPLREGKGFLYEGGLRVPLIVKWPGRGRAGAVADVPACSVDLFPTLLDICGVKRDAAVDGASLAGVLAGEASPERDALYWHYPHYSNQGGRPGGAIRSGEHKLIEFYENGRRELFHVSDRSESQNIADRHPEMVERLAKRLAGWRESVGAQMPTPNPDYVPNPQGKDGRIVLPARTADVHGAMVRFEPMPHKNTLGFWTRHDDWVSWEFTVLQPGGFDVQAHVGCGNGSGGSEVTFAVAKAGDPDESKQSLRLTVEETGGFQNFVPRTLGRVTIPAAGRYTLTVRSASKPGPAVMDLREVTLERVAGGD